jgi:hypothetical protein
MPGPCPTRLLPGESDGRRKGVSGRPFDGGHVLERFLLFYRCWPGGGDNNRFLQVAGGRLSDSKSQLEMVVALSEGALSP